MNGQKIIFFDIDGTLYDEDKKIPPSAKEAIFELKRKGHDVAIATGRAPFMFRELRKELEIDSFVSYNGQYVVFRGKVIYTNPLSKAALQTLTELALKHNHPVVYMDHEDMKASVPHNDFVSTSIGTLKVNHIAAYDPNYYKERDIYQALLFVQENEESYYESLFAAFDLIRWHPFACDIVPAGGSKAKGIKRITEQLGILPENQYAFGDALNDVEMLQAVPNSVAMGNGLPEAKAAAKYVTKSVDEDGIWHGLKMVGLL